MSLAATGVAMDRSQEFGEKLRSLREAKGWSQAELARRSGVRQANISRYEQGLREPSWSIAVALAAALGVNVDAFRPDAEGSS